MKCNCISRLYKEQELINIENSMNITRYFIVIIVSIGIGFFGLRFYENFSESSDLNIFLEEAYVISTLHNESSKDYQRDQQKCGCVQVANFLSSCQDWGPQKPTGMLLSQETFDRTMKRIMDSENASRRPQRRRCYTFSKYIIVADF